MSDPVLLMLVQGVHWKELQPDGIEAAGEIPFFVDDSDERPVAEQFNQHYAHGGGWRPMRGFEMDEHGKLSYPGDQPLVPLAIGMKGLEVIVVYNHSMIAILQRNGDFEVARMD